MTGSKALKAISQETFDDVVRENIEDFEMEPQEALDDAIQQFKSQGVNISIIIKEVPTNGKHKVALLAESLSDIVSQEESFDKESTQETIQNLKVELSSDLSKRYQACKTTNISQNLFNLCVMSSRKSCYQTDSFKAYCSLVNGQPDEATKEHLYFFLQQLRDSDVAEKTEVLCCIFKNLCTMQENNRQTLVKMGIIPTLMKVMETFIENAAVVRECCSTLRALTLDDDVRVEFGQFHEHAKMIVTEQDGLERFVSVFKEHYSDPVLAKEIASTLSRVMVRNEYCQEFVDMGGFDALRKSVSAHTAVMIVKHDSTVTYNPVILSSHAAIIKMGGVRVQGVVKNCVDLLQAISRNDEVKILVMKDGAAGMLMEVLDKYIANPSICESCFSALTTLTLRNPGHCKLVADARVAPMVAQAMSVHEKHAGVQRSACMLVRNLVARTRKYSVIFLELGIEELIRAARTRFSSVLDDEAKAALRDLDLEVDLKQLWTGTSQRVTN